MVMLGLELTQSLPFKVIYYKSADGISKNLYVKLLLYRRYCCTEFCVTPIIKRCPKVPVTLSRRKILSTVAAWK